MAASSHRVSSALGPVSRKSRELFGPEKPFVKLRPAFSVKLVFSYVVKGIKIKLNRAPVAQLIEHRSVTREVVSSTPVGPTLRVLK